MKLTIDNHDGNGAADYTSQIDSALVPRVIRKLNEPSQLAITLMASAATAIPSPGARIVLTRDDASAIFTGYLSAGAQQEYLGVGEQGPTVRQHLEAMSDEWLLDAKVLPDRAPFVERTAGSALKQLVQDLMPNGFDLSGVQDVDTLATYAVNSSDAFSRHAASIAMAVRANYRVLNGAIVLVPVGANTYTLTESDSNFSPEGLALESPAQLLNDVAVIGLDEPQAYVRDYFAGDGLTRQYYLSQTPFAQYTPALIDENYSDSMLDPATWQTTDPTSAISVTAQTLQVAGGTGQDGQTLVSFIEQIELGGAMELAHGEVSFSGSSHGVLGGLYAGPVSAVGCLAGFQITATSGGSTIQAIIQGAASGPPIATQAGHRYELTTYVYCPEVYRSQEAYHSSPHPAGSGLGGQPIAGDVRFVLEVHDIDPNDPSTWVAPANVLFDDVLPNAPGFVTYALVNAINMQCSLAFTYAAHIADVEVRAAAPGGSYTTQLVGRLSDGAVCEITSGPSLDFYPQYVPQLNALIVASYRGSGRAAAHVQNAASIVALQNGSDDGTRGIVKAIKLPLARTAMDCENAALAILDDSVAQAWAGTYRTWSDFLPGSAEDIFPGDALAVSVASRGAVFNATIRQVQIELADPANDRGLYTIQFANDQAEPLAMELGGAGKPLLLQDVPPVQTTGQVGNYYLLSLTGAQITAVTATTASIDAGVAPDAGFGIEVRANDYSWGPSNDSNLIGRFTTQTFTVPRLARAQNYFLRLYDSSSPPKYSRYSAALHVDYPL